MYQQNLQGLYTCRNFIHLKQKPCSKQACYWLAGLVYLPPTNNRLTWYRFLPWMNKVSTCQKALHNSSAHGLNQLYPAFQSAFPFITARRLESRTSWLKACRSNSIQAIRVENENTSVTEHLEETMFIYYHMLIKTSLE